MAIDGNGEASISYYDDAAGNLLYASRAGGTWSIEGVDTTGQVGQWSSLAFDSDGNAVISYCDRTNGELKVATETNLIAVNPLPVAGGLQMRSPIPNPRRGNQAVTLEFQLPGMRSLTFELLDARGRLVTRTVAGIYPAGSHRMTWKIGAQSPGVYFLRMRTETGQKADSKLVVLP
jgi:hypothetical protein